MIKVAASWVFGMLALLFQPIYKTALVRPLWHVVNVDDAKNGNSGLITKKGLYDMNRIGTQEECTNNGLNRFIEAQTSTYETAFAEITNGRKYSHWIWYIFPVIKGLGRSYNSNYYGLQDVEEAREYLTHIILGQRLKRISQALLNIENKTAFDILGKVDAWKVKSCMTLFDFISPNDVFAEVLEKYYDGKRSKRTLKKMGVV